MKLTEIMECVKNGFSFDQIKELNEMSKEPEPEQEPDKEPEPEPEPDKEPEPDYKALYEESQKALKEAQKNNVHEDNTGKDNRKTDEQVFAEFCKSFM